MCDHTFTRPFCRSSFAVAAQAGILAVLVVLIVPRGHALAESTQAVPAATCAAPVVDPFGPLETEVETDPFETVASDVPVDAAAYTPKTTRWDAKPANFEVPSVLAPPQQSEADLPAGTSTNTPTSTAAAAKDPCAAAQFKPLCELGISIAQPAGQSPTDFATPCWNQLNAGPNGACRCWPMLNYNWDATCLCYRPLYFEEINAERYGYVCNSCCSWCCCPSNTVQSAASAAHFFGTIPCLPYCMADECPGECVYTLGHYRPGSCAPWCCHWPSCDPLAAAATGGVYTGLIFAIP